MSVTIPGALADHLTAERPFDLDTRAALDSARRGRGRTLVIELENVTPLHMISRRAEHLLSDAYATDAQKRAARTWLKSAGRAPQIITLRFEDTETAYDASQCSEGIRSGDVLVVEAEQAVAFVWQAWPCAVTVAHGEFHRAEGDPREVEANTGPSVRAAIDAAHAIGAPLARVEDQAEAAQTIAEAAADDAPEANPTAADLLAEVEAAEQRAAASVAAHLDREYPALAAFLAAERTADRAAADEEAAQAAAMVTEAEATEGTWRGEWIGDRPTAPTLFDVEPDAEQGALFA